MTAKSQSHARQNLVTSLMTMLRDQGLLCSAAGAHDGSWIVRRTRSGPLIVLETPSEAIEYAVEVLVDYQLEAADGR